MDDTVDTPPPSRDQGHMALGTTEAIETDPSRGFVVETAPTSDGGEHGPPTSPLLETLKSAQMPQDIVREAVGYWQNGTTQSTEELASMDDSDRASATTELRSLWGDKLEDNLAAINTALDNMGPDGDAIRHARVADGRAVTNNPAVLARLLGLARTAGAKIPSGNDKATIAAAEKLMRTDRAAYNKDTALQARLIAAYGRQGANP